MPQLIKGDWGHFSNTLPNLMRVDLHFGRGEPGAFWDNMAKINKIVMESLKEAQEKNFKYVLFVHGYSTSRPGKMTTRSVVRSIMKDKESTQFVIKNRSFQHDSVFIAAIRQKRSVRGE